MNNDSRFKNVVEFGTWYFPASQHYGRSTDTHGLTRVHCDRCKAKNIVASLGYEQLDLCMGCVQMVVQHQITLAQNTPSFGSSSSSSSWTHSFGSSSSSSSSSSSTPSFWSHQNKESSESGRPMTRMEPRMFR